MMSGHIYPSSIKSMAPPKFPYVNPRATATENELKWEIGNTLDNLKEGEELQKPNDRFITGKGRVQRNVARQKEKVWSQKQAKQGNQIDTNNMFAALNDQEEAQEQLEKRTTILHDESHSSEEQLMEMKNNAEKGSEEEKQSAEEK
ncbi:hypothetical protein HAX54_015305 [Datura stramonium]|uniref:Uncharacterized protein n=1 Tax=Datura stramonium TaxID=4076 RepID=A0ABS8TRM4_DATST|nr:hypothetical protein [Datura stramonium]